MEKNKKSAEEVMMLVQESVQKAFNENYLFQVSNEENLERLKQSANSFLNRMIAEGRAPEGSKVVAEINPVDPTIIEWNIVDKNGVPLLWEESGDET